jgi:O-antigen ligase
MANRKSQKSKPNNQKANPATPKKGSSGFLSTTAKSSTPTADTKPTKWLIWGGALTTLVVGFSLNDPFNSPKSWVLSIAGFWLLGWLGFNFKHYFQDKTLRLTALLAAIFAATLALAWIATDNKFIGFFGQYGRKTGLLEYLSLIIFFLAAAYVIRLTRTGILERTIIFMGSVSGIYGFFQHYKIDFIKWPYLYNSVLGTLGNPDFAGAMMAILLVFNFGIAIEPKHKKWIRGIAAFNVPLLAVVIVFSQARQGLLAAGLGIGFIALVWIYQRKKNVALALTGLSALGAIVVIAGLLNIGPGKRFFYKVSVTYRGDYWRAAVRMFTHHPIFGVGLDRYGAYFRQYRDATQTLRRGPLIVADAAHDVPLQLAATGGILVLLAFLTLTGFTLWRGIVALRRTQGSAQIMVAVIFGAWITYQAQSLISIDNIGIAIWGYILGGAVIGISILPDGAEAKTPLRSGAQPVVSGVLALLLVIVSFLFFQSEGDMHTLKAIIPPKSASLLKEYEQYANKPVSHLFKDPSFVLITAQDYQAVGDTAKAISTYKGVIASDPRNVNAISELSAIYASQKNWAEAITLDRELVKLDPYNQVDLLQLGRDLKLSGDLAGAKSVIPLINAFAPNTTEAKQAQSEFGK